MNNFDRCFCGHVKPSHRPPGGRRPSYPDLRPFGPCRYCHCSKFVEEQGQWEVWYEAQREKTIP